MTLCWVKEASLQGYILLESIDMMFQKRQLQWWRTAEVASVELKEGYNYFGDDRIVLYPNGDSGHTNLYVC